jgi:hypothetical protein
MKKYKFFQEERFSQVEIKVSSLESKGWANEKIKSR